MPIVRVSNAAALRKVSSGGGQNFDVPGAWLQAAYGSGWPIAPVSAPTDVAIPRTIDYPIAVNSTLTPRTGYALMPFSSLKEAYENVTECRMPVSLIHRELTSFVPKLVDNEGNEVDDHDFAWMTESPDRKTPYGVWQTRLLKSAKVYDAPSVYLEWAGSTLQGLHYIDGSTLFLIIDQQGNTPEPEPIEQYIARTASSSSSYPSASHQGTPGPDSLASFLSQFLERQRQGLDVPTKVPAYCQIIKGTPFSWWSADQIWYMPQSRRMDSPYGESFIEAAWPWIMVIVNLTAFELGHYRTGNMPEGFMTIPQAWAANPTALLTMEEMYNYRMTNNPATERMRIRLFPDGSKYFGTKKPDFPAGLYKQAWNNVLHSIGIPPSEFGEVPGQGLGGKGFKEGAATDLGRNTLNPHREFISSLFNYALEKAGVDDVKFVLAYPLDEIDPDKQKQSVYDGLAHGALSLNDALGELGYDLIGKPDDLHNIANKHLIVAGAAIYVIEDMQVQNGMAIPAFTGKPGGTTGGTPAGPETAVEQQGAEHTPEDNKTIISAIKNLMENGTLDGKTISVSSGKRFTPQQADEAEYRAAGDEDEEIDPQPLEKHCGVCPEDDDYYGAPISREVLISFPAEKQHVNGVEIVTAVPPGLPPKPALWKPEGAENDHLRAVVGGPLYPREEAAYLIDRSLKFFLVPVAWVSESNSEEGAAIYFTSDMGPALDPADYAPEWIERAAVLDYVLSQQDRGYHHNYGTHPDDPSRIICFDNGYSLPENPALYVVSPFAALMINKPLSAPTLSALKLCQRDASTWSDVQKLVGPDATSKALHCLQELLDDKTIKMHESISSDGSWGL